MSDDVALRCPVCGSEEFLAIEQVQAFTRCRLLSSREVEESGQTEFERDMATAVTLAYKCAAPTCNFVMEAHNWDRLKTPDGSEQAG